MTCCQRENQCQLKRFLKFELTLCALQIKLHTVSILPDLFHTNPLTSLEPTPTHEAPFGTWNVRICEMRSLSLNRHQLILRLANVTLVMTSNWIYLLNFICWIYWNCMLLSDIYEHFIAQSFEMVELKFLLTSPRFDAFAWANHAIRTTYSSYSPFNLSIHLQIVYEDSFRLKTFCRNMKQKYFWIICYIHVIYQ